MSLLIHKWYHYVVLEILCVYYKKMIYIIKLCVYDEYWDSKGIKNGYDLTFTMLLHQLKSYCY